MKRLVALLSVVAASTAGAQAGGPSMAPVNDLPNPYQTISGWAKLPEGRTWGSTSAVTIDRDGSSVWVAERCGANSCTGSSLDPVLLFDAGGNLVRHFGAGLFQAPHGITLDRNGNVWVVDCSCTGGGRGGRGRGTDTARPAAAPPPPPAAPSGHQIFEFSRDGKLLKALGTPGGGRGAAFFFQPNAVLVAPNGDIFVSEGHASNANATARVYKFSKDGTLIKTWGQWGAGPDDFDQPHALAMDSRGRLFVGDRGNNRIKIFDQDGTLLDTWYQFSRPSGIWIDPNDNIYVADSESGSVNPAHGAWKRGIRIGSAKDGSVKYFIPDPWPTCAQGQQSSAAEPCSRSTSAAEGVAVDRNGVIYGAEVGPMRLQKYVKP
ncbi:MAG TPA: peptidyl-alpha-hydroxyglycine alpha-amidating lyase family protein [Gemmatimonadaceae bacterium]|nr:peptidyl-alpha-hydroxyglycine alpha-amidating lyase family protein [Gemmatimonadaceae bacterium]